VLLLKSERGGDLRRVRGENAQGGCSGAEETRGETLATVGGEYAESELELSGKEEAGINNVINYIVY
jgi:hypothetical protein